LYEDKKEKINSRILFRETKKFVVRIDEVKDLNDFAVREMEHIY